MTTRGDALKFHHATGPGRRRRSRGQALVEFALVIPLFFLILAGVLDFGFMLYSRMTVINAAREGARIGVTATAAPNTIPTLVDSSARAAATGLTSASLSVTSACVDPVTGVGGCVFATGTNAAVKGDSVKVTVHYTYRSFFPLLFGSTFDLSSTVQMVLE